MTGPTRSEAARAVAEFHRVFDLPTGTEPSAEIDAKLAGLRNKLMTDEVEELLDAVEHRDIEAIADALGDIVYVAYGTALTYGIDLDAVFREIHRANLSKLGADGRPLVREDGKVRRSDRYVPPNIAAALGRGNSSRSPAGGTT